MSPCERTRAGLERALANLPRTTHDEDELRAHLAGCEPCSQLLERVARATEALRAVAGVAPPPPQFPNVIPLSFTERRVITRLLVIGPAFIACSWFMGSGDAKMWATIWLGLLALQVARFVQRKRWQRDLSAGALLEQFRVEVRHLLERRTRWSAHLAGVGAIVFLALGTVGYAQMHAFHGDITFFFLAGILFAGMEAHRAFVEVPRLRRLAADLEPT
jgi:hypothetical protein